MQYVIELSEAEVIVSAALQMQVVGAAHPGRGRNNSRILSIALSCSEVRARQVQLTGASLGAMPWGQRDAFVLEETGGKPPAGLQGLLGVTSLKTRRVGFDPDRKVLAWDQSAQ